MSVSVPAEVAELIRAQAVAAGASVSAWIAAAALEKAAAAEATATAAAAAAELLADIEAEHGPVTPADHLWATEVLASAGVITRAAG